MRGGGVVQKSCPFSGHDFWPAFSVLERELQPDWRAVASSKKRDRAEMKSYIYVYRSVRNLQVREMFGNEIVVESGALFYQPTPSHYSCSRGPPTPAHDDVGSIVVGRTKFHNLSIDVRIVNMFECTHKPTAQLFWRGIAARPTPSPADPPGRRHTIVDHRAIANQGVFQRRPGRARSPSHVKPARPERCLDHKPTPAIHQND